MSICANCSSSKPIRRRCSTPTPPLSANTFWPIPPPARCWRNRLRQRGRQLRLRMRGNGARAGSLALFGGSSAPASPEALNSNDPLGLLMGGAVPLAQPDEPVQPPAPPSPPPIAAQPQAPRPQPTPPPVQTPEPHPNLRRSSASRNRLRSRRARASATARASIRSPTNPLSGSTPPRRMATP